jgi:hypothetical protein
MNLPQDSQIVVSSQPMIPMTSAIIDASNESNRKPAGYNLGVHYATRVLTLCDSVWVRAHPRISAAARFKMIIQPAKRRFESSDVDGHFTTDRYFDRNSFAEVIGRLFSRMSTDMYVCMYACACVNTFSQVRMLQTQSSRAFEHEGVQTCR